MSSASDGAADASSSLAIGCGLGRELVSCVVAVIVSSNGDGSWLNTVEISMELSLVLECISAVDCGDNAVGGIADDLPTFVVMALFFFEARFCGRHEWSCAENGRYLSD